MQILLLWLNELAPRPFKIITWLLYILHTVPYVLFTLLMGRRLRIWETMSGFTTLAVIKRVNTFRYDEVATKEQLELVVERDEHECGSYERAAVGRRY
jgi:hypothetical protein